MPVTLSFTPPAPVTGTTVFAPIKIGGGGFITGMHLSADGLTRLARTDAFGVYIWEGGKWEQLCVASRLPANSQGGGEWPGGSHAMASAPSNSAIIYFTYVGYVFKSVDRGQTLTRTSFAYREDMHPNSEVNTDWKGSRLINDALAIDPANPNVVYVSTNSGGVFRTEDGGTSWALVTAIPLSGSPNRFGNTITFDATSGTTGGKTNRIIINSPGNGVYQTTNAASSWTNIAAATGPTHGAFQNARFASDGVFYCTECTQTANAAGRGARLYRYQSSTWTDISPAPGFDYGYITVNPADNAHIVSSEIYGPLFSSLDRGATWKRNYLFTYSGNSDAPWLEWTNTNNSIANAGVHFDPTVAGRIWMATGLSPIYTDDFLSDADLAPCVFTYVVNGIEELAACQIIAPDFVGAKPLLVSHDRPFFVSTNPNVHPTTHGPNRVNYLAHGWWIDYASSDPTFLVGVAQPMTAPVIGLEGYSTDNGRTWTAFTTQPPDVNSTGFTIKGEGGTVAVSTPLNILRAHASYGDLIRTHDGGATWIRCVVPGVPVANAGSNDPGWGQSSFFKRSIIAADRVTLNKFYAYNYGGSSSGTPAANARGIHVSTDGGATWTRVYPYYMGEAQGESPNSTAINGVLKSVPGKAGHLFYYTGYVQRSNGLPLDVPQYGSMFHSHDGATNWARDPTFIEISGVGFGKAAPGNDYPTVFLVGWKIITPGSAWDYGIWRSTSTAAQWAANTQTWTKIGVEPYGWQDSIIHIDGDKNVYGRLYGCFNGSSAFYGYLT